MSGHIMGIRNQGDYWVWFDQDGERPGKFETADAARNGCWITPENARAINDGERRLINEADCRWGMRTWKWPESSHDHP